MASTSVGMEAPVVGEAADRLKKCVGIGGNLPAEPRRAGAPTADSSTQARATMTILPG